MKGVKEQSQDTVMQELFGESEFRKWVLDEGLLSWVLWDSVSEVKKRDQNQL